MARRRPRRFRPKLRDAVRVNVANVAADSAMRLALKVGRGERVSLGDMIGALVDSVIASGGGPQPSMHLRTEAEHRALCARGPALRIVRSSEVQNDNQGECGEWCKCGQWVPFGDLHLDCKA